MNKMLTPNGGMPLELDDFNFIQNAYKEALKGVFSEIAQRVPNTGHPNTYNNFIISGCEASDIGGGNSSVSEGFVFIDGEILYCPAVATFATAFLPNAAYRIHTYNDPAGNELFEDGISRDTYEVRRGELILLGGGPGFKVVFFAQPGRRYKDLLTHADVTSIYDYNVDSTLSSGWTGNDDGGTGVFVKVIKQFGVVKFRGQVYGGTLAGSLLCILSPAYRPKTNMVFCAPYGIDGIARLNVNSDGNIYVSQIITPSSGIVLDLNNISFTIE